MAVITISRQYGTGGDEIAQTCLVSCWGIDASTKT